MFYGHTSYLDTPTLNGFGVVKERFSNLRNLYQLSSILVIGSWGFCYWYIKQNRWNNEEGALPSKSLSGCSKSWMMPNKKIVFGMNKTG